jgi:hypothetical protein
VVEVVVSGDRHPPRSREAAAVDQAGVGVGVTDDQGVGVGEGGEGGEVRGIPGGENERGGRAEEPGERGLQVVVDRQGAGDQTARAGPAAVTLHGGNGRRDHARVGAQTEVVVAREVEQVARFRRVQATREAARGTAVGSIGQPVEELGHATILRSAQRRPRS